MKKYFWAMFNILATLGFLLLAYRVYTGTLDKVGVAVVAAVLVIEAIVQVKLGIKDFKKAKMTIFVVWAESSDWCGIESEKYLVNAENEDHAVDIAATGGIVEDEVYIQYNSDESDEEYIAEPCISIKAEEFNVS